MKPEQRVWVASLISAGVMVVYANYMGQHTPPPRPTAASSQPTAMTAPEPQAQPASSQLLPDEEVTSIESSDIRLEIGQKSAAVKTIELKKFRTVDTKEPLRFGDASPALFVKAGSGNEPWVEIARARTPTGMSWTKTSAGVEAVLFVSLADRSTYHVNIDLKNQSNITVNVPVDIESSWNRGDSVSGTGNVLEAVFNTNKRHGWQRQYLKYHPANKPKNVPRGTSMMTLSDRFFCQAVVQTATADSFTVLPTPQTAIAGTLHTQIVVPANGTASYGAKIYAGARDFFLMRDAGFEKTLPIGMLGQIGLILVLILKWIAGIVHNYGIAIILMGAFVTVALSPFTMLSFRSMKKMQELQPRMDQLKKKHEKDATKLNQEMLALFREHKVSPLSGCLPMLIQMPVFFALWSAISHVIEFRGERFLWIKDLSLPDHLAMLPGGIALNILPILMAGAMYFQTKFTQPKVQSATPSPLAGPMMPILFGFMFYTVPSSLVLYWLTNSLASIAIYKIAK